MTIIVAVRNPDTGEIAMAADRASQVHGDMVPVVTDKIHRHGDMLIGMAGQAILRDALLARVSESGEAEIGAKNIGATMRKVAEDLQAWTLEKGETLGDTPAAGMIAWAGDIYLLSTDGGVVQVDLNYWAIGSMREYAMGAMYVLERDSEQIAWKAMRAVMACRFGRHYLPGEPQALTLEGEGMNQPVIKQSLTTGVCSNCREALCDTTKAFDRSYERHPQSLTWCMVCFCYPKALHHHRGGTPANERCTRPMRVLVKGCYECPTRGDGFNCGLDEQRRSVHRNVNGYLWNIARSILRPEWCPLTDDGQPNAGIHVVADAPTKEEG